MRQALLASLLLVAPAAVGELRADAPQESLADALRKRFPEQEQWMLSAVLSDDAQNAAYQAEGKTAMQGGKESQEDFVLRWRKKALLFASAYRRHLQTTDIVPDAPNVEKMVAEFEFNVANYWLMHQPPAKQAQAKRQLADGNAVLGFARAVVEAKVRDKRRQTAEELGSYLDSPSAKTALAYAPHQPQDPGTQARAPQAPPAQGGSQAPPAKNALEQLEQSASGSRSAAATPRPEDSSGGADRPFSGSPGAPGEAAPPVVAVPPAGSAPAPALEAGLAADPEAGMGQGGFKIKPPPSPVVSREEVHKSSALGVLAKMAAPPVLGAAAGGILGLLLGGPIGAIIGVLAGAAVGYAAGRILSR